jgi:uncharacterized protein
LNAATQRFVIDGPCGALEVALDLPAQETAAGLAVIAHPHPLFGGTMDNKVVQTIVRAFTSVGMICLRANFRGVGKSAGTHDHGVGEVEDLWAAWQWLLHEFPQVAGMRWMAGFSFGAVMTTHIAHEWPTSPIARGQPELSRVVLVGLGLSPERRAPAPLTAAARLIHGQEDDVILLADVQSWAGPQGFGVSVIQGAGHFFHGQLNTLKMTVLESLER